mmetsp:Transcript_112/g.54  ORF Transcript_112/g.54 Transcript_112/m.54 type:complete len:107 (-) Transcript_112:15-335(-)
MAWGCFKDILRKGKTGFFFFFFFFRGVHFPQALRALECIRTAALTPQGTRPRHCWLPETHNLDLSEVKVWRHSSKQGSRCVLRTKWRLHQMLILALSQNGYGPLAT